MTRAQAIRSKKNGVKLNDKFLSNTDFIGFLGSIFPFMLNLRNKFVAKPRPIFPVKAKKLIDTYNLKEGRELGAFLKELELIWIENNFRKMSPEKYNDFNNRRRKNSKLYDTLVSDSRIDILEDFASLNLLG